MKNFLKRWSTQAQKGFTLIEILVVITVIGILLAAGGAAFLNVQKSARDSERLKELVAIQDALEQRYAAEGAYTDVNTGDTIAGLESAVGSGGYFPNGVPAAPTGGGGVPYTFVNDSSGTAGAASYCICGTLEQPARANASGSDGATGQCNFTTTSPTLFCLQNKQ